MPPKPHFVTTEELSNLRGKHQIMSEEVRQWLQTETNRVNNTTQYRIQGRSSMDDALRLFLIADKNFSLEAALDLNISPEEQENLRAFLRLENVVDQALHAKNRLDEAERNKEELSPEIKEDLTGKVDAYYFYAAAWEHNRNAFLQSPQHMAYDEKRGRVLFQRATGNLGSTAPGEARNCVWIRVL